MLLVVGVEEYFIIDDLKSGRSLDLELIKKISSTKLPSAVGERVVYHSSKSGLLSSRYRLNYAHVLVYGYLAGLTSSYRAD